MDSLSQKRVRDAINICYKINTLLLPYRMAFGDIMTFFYLKNTLSFTLKGERESYFRAMAYITSLARISGCSRLIYYLF